MIRCPSHLDRQRLTRRRRPGFADHRASAVGEICEPHGPDRFTLDRLNISSENVMAKV